MIIGRDMASGPDITVYITVPRVSPAPVIDLAKYRKAKVWRALKRRLDSGELVLLPYGSLYDEGH